MNRQPPKANAPGGHRGVATNQNTREQILRGDARGVNYRQHLLMTPGVNPAAKHCISDRLLAGTRAAFLPGNVYLVSVGKSFATLTADGGKIIAWCDPLPIAGRSNAQHCIRSLVDRFREGWDA